MRLLLLSLMMLLSGCATSENTAPKQQNLTMAVRKEETLTLPETANTELKVVSIDPAQLPHAKKRSQMPTSGLAAVDSANKSATIKPVSGRLVNSIVVFPYQEGYLYKIYSTPLNVTDIAFQPGE